MSTPKIKIISLGCSFTAKYKDDITPWPELIGSRKDAIVFNYGKNSTGNRYAYDSLIHHIINDGPVDEVYWLMSEFDRIDIKDNSLYPIDFNKDKDYLNFVDDMLKNHENKSLLNSWNKKIEKERKISAALSQTPFEYWIDSNLILISNVQKICASYGIKLKIIQGLRPLNYYLSHYDERSIAKAILSSRYSNLIDLECVVGYPWMKISGGHCVVERDDWMSTYAISESDDHPSQKGHEFIADLFLS